MTIFFLFSLYFPFQASIPSVSLPQGTGRETIDGWIPGEKRKRKKKTMKKKRH
jgi:hypothetical protein